MMDPSLGGLLDVWSFWHLVAGLVVGLVRVRILPVLAGAFAWEWLEEAGLGPVGSDPAWQNSLADVAVAIAGWSSTWFAVDLSSKLRVWRSCYAARP